MSSANDAKGWALPALLAAAGGVAVATLPGKTEAVHEVPTGVTVVESYQGHHRFDWRQENETRFQELTTTHGPATLTLPAWVEIDQVTYGKEQLRFERLAAKTQDGQDVTTDLQLDLQAEPSAIGRLDQQHPRWARDLANMVAESWTDTVAGYDHHELPNVSLRALDRTLAATITSRLAEEIPGLALISANTSNLQLNGKPMRAAPLEVSQIKREDVTQWRTQRAAAKAAAAPDNSPRLAIGG